MLSENSILFELVFSYSSVWFSHPFFVCLC